MKEKTPSWEHVKEKLLEDPKVKEEYERQAFYFLKLRAWLALKSFVGSINSLLKLVSLPSLCVTAGFILAVMHISGWSLFLLFGLIKSGQENDGM